MAWWEFVATKEPLQVLVCPQLWSPNELRRACVIKWPAPGVPVVSPDVCPAKLARPRRIGAASAMSINYRSLRARPPSPLPAIREASRVLDSADVVDYCFSRPWRRAFGTRQRCDERESLCDFNTLRAPGLGQRMTDSLTSFPSVEGLVRRPPR